MNMDTATQPAAIGEKKPVSNTPWIILALWVAWLAALMVMSFPEWGKSKRDLLEIVDRPATQTGAQPK